MTKFSHAAVFAAGVAAASLAVALVPGLAYADALSLQSFGAAKAASAYELSQFTALQPQVAASLNSSSMALGIGPGAPAPQSGATSAMLASNLALDGGRNLDVASRFIAYGDGPSPFLSAVTAPYLALANGGRYSGITFAPSSNLHMRLGASLNSERLDRFSFDSIAPTGPLALTYDASQTKSLLAGLSWDVSSVLGVDVTGISAERSGVPLGLANVAGIAPRASTNALGLAAHMDMGKGWVTTASFSEGMTQLDQRGTLNTATLHEQAYSIAIAKHGLFGDDALGLSFSAPAPSMANTGFSLSNSSDMPLVVGQSPAIGQRAQETDIQLGYITNFLDGAVALQTNAAYQTNVQGQRGATSVSLLSRAKIKF